MDTPDPMDARGRPGHETAGENAPPPGPPLTAEERRTPAARAVGHLLDRVAAVSAEQVRDAGGSMGDVWDALAAEGRVPTTPDELLARLDLESAEVDAAAERIVDYVDLEVSDLHDEDRERLRAHVIRELVELLQRARGAQ